MTGRARDSGGILGSLSSADGKGVVRMEDRLDIGIDDLWSAFIERERLARWLGDVEGDLRLGGDFRARFFASGWEGTGRVEACEPPQRLLVRTAMEGTQEVHAIEVTLTADGDTTALILEERGMPLEQLAAYGAGVQVHVEDLGAYVGGGERVDAEKRWEALMPAYEKLAAGVGGVN